MADEGFSPNQPVATFATASRKASANLSGASSPPPSRCCLGTRSLVQAMVCNPAQLISGTQRSPRLRQGCAYGLHQFGSAWNSPQEFAEEGKDRLSRFDASVKRVRHKPLEKPRI